MRYDSLIEKKIYNKMTFRKMCIILASVVTLSTGLSYGLNKINSDEYKTQLSEMVQLGLSDSQRSKLNEINLNTRLYPKSLRKAATKSSEIIDFVYNYPTMKNTKATNSPAVSADYKKGEIPLFTQWDDRWGYTKYGDDVMGLTGCAPTTIAMAAVGVTGDTSITPRVVADYSEKNGFYVKGAGTSWNLINKGVKHFGIKTQGIAITKDNIINNLKKGIPMIISLKPGNFTTEGHFILLTGIASDNTIKVHDPYSNERTYKHWDVDTFVNEGKGLWSVTKLNK